ncbi:hypothetical protein MTBBW1_530003 [Desulfamplus magnetovallimortis]|uniref:Uncharacterized protein n=1 Tax=Desulfamplus magnetovallimortis TaxID=1246637 RepID=A0A1W1HHZ6_9BACT|nr:hypothetical protein MTBBW1_530003 [Desulfamplus magnetovallimortis]
MVAASITACTVNCRTGSLENVAALLSYHLSVNCRTGSLERQNT